MIQVSNLSKIFKQKDGSNLKAVDDLSFVARPGEIVTLLGVNGAGKTTAMRIISTVLKPSSGSVLIDKFDISSNPQKVRSRLGFISGDTSLYARLTPRELITYFGKLYDVDQTTIKRRIVEMSRLLDMESYLDKKIDFLSTGMKQKVSICRTVIHDPPVMILDEPTSGLDILTAHNIVNFIHTSKASGKCILFSTHIMREAERISDRIILIHHGRILAQGSLSELREKTDLYDLDDIFIDFVKKQSDDFMEDNNLFFNQDNIQ